jgi:hypothetical protein
LTSDYDKDSSGKTYPCCKVYDAETYQFIKSIRLPLNDLEVALSNDNRILFAANKDEFDYYFIDFETGQILNEAHDYDNARIFTYTFTNDNQLLLTTWIKGIGQGTGEARFINLSSYKVDYKHKILSKLSALSPDGNLIALQDWESKTRAVVIMDAHTHQILKEIPGWGNSIIGMSFSPESQLFAYSYATHEEAVQIINLYDMEVKYKFFFDPHGYHLIVPSISNNARYLAGYNSKTLYLYDFSKTVGIEEVPEEIDTIYPNPTNGFLNIDFFNPIDQIVEFNLYDLQGIKLSNIKSQFYPQGQTHEEFTIGNYAPGTYFLKLESLGFNKTFRLIIGG